MSSAAEPQVHNSRRVALAALVVAVAAAGFALTSPASAQVQVSAVTGSAYGYYTDVSLFGGPSMRRGFGQPASAPASAASPSVELASTGGNETDSDADGAAGVYGPATIFGGIWPESAPSSPPSGPISVAAEGTTGASGSVTSSADIVLYDPPVAAAPGGIGPGPVIADEAHSTCTANATGITASASFVDGILETKYDESSQLPIEDEPIPANPAPNYTRTGTIDHVGDAFTVIFNEQIDNPDGSLTVNAVHVILEGPTAVGHMYIASSTCGATTTGSGGSTTSTSQPGGSTTSTTQPGGGDGFSDIAGTTHEFSINAVAAAGIAGGFPDGTYRPAAQVTRGQMATFLSRALDLAPGAPGAFSDTAGNTHDSAIGAVAAAGIAGGFPDGTYRPNAPVSRGQMAAFLSRARDLPPGSPGAFSDVGGTTHELAIGAVAAAGIAGGFADGTYRPAADVTRGQMATFLDRAFLSGG